MGELKARDVAKFVYQNAGYFSTAKLVYEFSFILFPLFVLLGAIAFKLCMVTFVEVFGLGRRYCNVVMFAIVVTLLILATLLFIAFFPFLMDDSSSTW